MGTWRATLTAAQEAVQAAVDALGLDSQPQVVTDPRLLSQPGIYLKLTGVRGETLTGGYALVTVYAVVADGGDWMETLDQLQALATPVLGVIPAMDAQPTLVALPLPGGGTPAPAVRWDHDLTLDM